MGSACLFFALHPRRALLGDINSALVDVFQAIRDHPGYFCMSGGERHRGLTNRSSQPLAVAMCTFNFMIQFREFAALAVISGRSAPSR
jgi:hypothetical protein